MPSTSAYVHVVCRSCDHVAYYRANSTVSVAQLTSLTDSSCASCSSRGAIVQLKRDPPPDGTCPPELPGD